MSATRWAVSLFLIWHITSISLASLPPAARPDAIGPARHPTDDPIAEMLTPALDRAAKTISGFNAVLSAAIRPLRRLTAIYVRATGLRQNWNMFTRPWPDNRYARLRYYVASHASKAEDAKPTRMATEIVFPKLQREQRAHLLQSYRAFAEDKAFMTAVEGISPERSLAELPSDLVPTVRYFSNRYRRNHLASEERIVRTEVWLGRSPLRRPGAGIDPQAEGRTLALIESYGGPVEEAVKFGTYPPIHAIETQGDIVWRLEFFDR